MLSVVGVAVVAVLTPGPPFLAVAVVPAVVVELFFLFSAASRRSLMVPHRTKNTVTPISMKAIIEINLYQ